MEYRLRALAEKALLERQQLPEKFGPAAVKPSYDGLGLVNIPALALEVLGVPGDGPVVPAFNPDHYGSPEISQQFKTLLSGSPINHVVVLLIDALGYDQLTDQFNRGEAPNLSRLTAGPQTFFTPLTSVYPSTTTTALTSLATARAPQDHGIMGTTVYYPRLGLTANMIGFSYSGDTAPISPAILNPDALLPVPNIYRALEEQGVTCRQINYAAYKGSSISRFTSAGSQISYIGYQTPAGALAALRQVVESLPNDGSGKSYTYTYISTIDSTAHSQGPLSAPYEAELATIDFALQREIISRLERPDVLLLITADHGQCYTNFDHILWVNEYPELARLVSAPAGGEGRAAYLYLKHGQGIAEKARALVESIAPGEFAIITKEEALAGGLFGNPEQAAALECEERIGDLILCPTGDWQARYSVREEKFYLTTGVHGGLSRSEMLIPFIALRLG